MISKHYKILSDWQYGFKEKISAQDAITCLTNTVYSTLYKGLHVCVCL